MASSQVQQRGSIHGTPPDNSKQTAHVFARFALAVVVPFDAVYSRLWVPVKHWVGGTAVAAKRHEQEQQGDLHNSADANRITR